MKSKDAVRKEVLKARNRLSAAEVDGLSQKVIKNLIGEFEISGDVMSYFPIMNEVNVRKLNQSLLDSTEATLYFPAVLDETDMAPYIVKNIDGPSMFSKQGNTKEINTGVELDFILVPLVVFDESCNRVGFGKGYYDRFLIKQQCSKAKKVGLAYSIQQAADSIAADPHDVALDAVVTDKKIYWRNQ